MCTLTFLPKDKGYIVTQNRDESPKRGRPDFPFRSGNLVYPRDPDGDGTWMLTDGEYVICVLNGAYVPYDRNPPYRHSRGLLPKIALENKPVGLTAEDAAGLEPFSVFLFHHSIIKRFSWDGSELYTEEFETNRTHIWQSAPLYTQSMQSTRKMWFEDWLDNNPTPGQNSVLDFHLNGGEGVGETNICMYRPGVQTTAITQVSISPSQSRFYYQSILSGEKIAADL